MAMPDLVLKTAPVAMPVGLDEAKRQTGTTFTTDFDTMLDGYIAAAVSKIDGKEGDLFRCLMPQTWRMYLNTFPACLDIPIPLGPVVSIVSVTYFDATGTLQTVDPDDYTLLIADGQDDTILQPVYGKLWPFARCQRRAVTIEYAAGYPDAASVPASIRHALLLHVTHLYENKGIVGEGQALPMAYEALLHNFKRSMV